MSHSAMVQKAANMLTTAGLTPGAKLPPEVGSKFVSNVYDQSGLTNKVTTAKFRSSEKIISLLTLDQRLMFPKMQGVDTGRLASYITSDVKLNPQDWKVVVEVPYQIFQQNIEGEKFKKTLIDEISKKIGNELEEMALHGNTLGYSRAEKFLDPKNGSTTKRVKDPLLSEFNGWLKQADANIYDANNSNNMSLIFNDLLNEMPEHYKMDLPSSRFIVPTMLEQQYIYQLTGRNTILGDQMQTGAMSVQAFKVPLLALPLFGISAPKVEHVTLTGTTPQALGYKNIDDSKVFVNTITLDDKTAETPYVDTVDYVINEANGTIARTSGSAIPSGTTVKVSYGGSPEALLTNPANLLIGINTDNIMIQYDVDIKKDVVIIAISGSFSVNTLKQDAVRKAINIKLQSQLI